MVMLNCWWAELFVLVCCMDIVVWFVLVMLAFSFTVFLVVLIVVGWRVDYLVSCDIVVVRLVLSVFCGCWGLLICLGVVYVFWM